MSSQLNLKKLTKEFIPMSLSDWVMALGDPMIALFIVLLPGGAINLAAFGVAKAIVVFFESPIIMILHASNALSRNRRSQILLCYFTFVSGFLLSSLLFLTAYFLPILMEYGLGSSLSISAKESVRYMTLILSPWPFLIAIRRYLQGIVIAAGKSHIVATGSFIRLAVMGSSLILLSKFYPIAFIVTAVSMMTGLISECVFVILKSLSIKSIEGSENEALPQDFKALIHYYMPLAWTMISLWGSRLGLTLILASIDENLVATWAAGWALVVSLANGVRMIQQIVIRHDRGDNRQLVYEFTWLVGLCFSLLFLSLGLFPYGQFLVFKYSGSDTNLALQIRYMLLAFTPLPIIMTWQNALQAKLLNRSRTVVIGRISIFSNICLLMTMTLLGIASRVSITTSIIVTLVMALLEVSLLYLANSKSQIGIEKSMFENLPKSSELTNA
jgi:hypothetical protein